MEGICDGTFVIRTRDNYWRADNTTLSFYYCGAPVSGDSCFNDTQCLPGYHGPLCSTCLAGYGKTSLTCSKCPDTSSNGALFAAVVMIITVVLGFLVMSFMTGNQNDEAPIVLRNLVTHMQILSKLAELQVQWPSLLDVLWSILSKVQIEVDGLSPVDCACARWVLSQVSSLAGVSLGDRYLGHTGCLHLTETLRAL